MEWLNAYQTEINQSLAALFTRKPSPASAAEIDFWDMLEYAVQGGGKRMRPVLGLCAYETGPDPVCNREQAIQVLRSLELMHAYSLVHDDLPSLDNDELRRGQPTVWKKFGEANAVLVGDGLQTLAFENLAHTSPSALIPELLSCLAQASGMHGLLAGQVRDLYFDHHKPSLHELERTHRLKTGALIQTSALWGGLLGGVEKPNLLAQYGQTIGLLFQVKDDLLDFNGNQAKAGKTLGKDANRKGYVFLLGETATQTKLTELTTDALEIAHKLGSDKLACLARFIAERDH